MAAGTSSRFVPLSYERPKGLLEVKGEILIERQIRQLKEAGIEDIAVVVGYKHELFQYLKDRFRVSLVMNEDYERFNNTSSLVRVLERLRNTYICSSDNYFPHNVFLDKPERSYYSALFAEGCTSEYCIISDSDDEIQGVTIGGRDNWYMVGHVYFSSEFSKAFSDLLRKEYEKEEVKKMYWEDVYIKNLNSLPGMQIRKYGKGEILEFDSLDELRAFDPSYLTDSRSSFIRDIAQRMKCVESDLSDFRKEADSMQFPDFSFTLRGIRYRYQMVTDRISII